MSEPVTVPTEAPRPARSRPATRQAWIDRIARFRNAGLTPAQFCAHEGVSLPNFYAWKRRLDTTTAATGTPAPDDVGPRLLPVRLLQPAPVELVLPGGAVLRLVPGCDLDFVRDLLRALGGTPC